MDGDLRPGRRGRLRARRARRTGGPARPGGTPARPRPRRPGPRRPRPPASPAPSRTRAPRGSARRPGRRRSTTPGPPARRGRAARARRPRGRTGPGGRRRRRWPGGHGRRRPAGPRRAPARARPGGSGPGTRWPHGRRPRGSRSTRSTSSETRPAFHGLHAAGPVAWLSATVRKCRSSSSRRSPTWSATDVDRGRVVEVAAGGDVGQQEVVAHHGHEQGDVAGREAHPRRDLLDDHLAGDGVVVAPDADEALADVVQQRADEEQVGPVDLAGVGGGAGRRLAQVPVDGEPVVGVALRPAADRRPLGQQADEQALLVEGLEHRDGGPPGAEQGHEVGAGLGRPAAGPGRPAPRPPDGRGCDGRATSPPWRPPPPPAGPGPGRTPGRRRPPARPGPRAARARRRRAVGRRHPAPRARAATSSIRSHASSLVHAMVRAAEDRRPMRTSASASPRACGDRVLLLEQEAVVGLAGPPLELDAGLQHGAVGGVEGVVVALEEDAPGRLGPVQGVDVAQPAPALLEVGLEEERHLARLLVAFGHRPAEGGQPPRRRWPATGPRPAGPARRPGRGHRRAGGCRAGRWPC